MSTALPMPCGPTIRPDIERPEPAVLAAACALPSATLHEAGGRIGVLPSAINPVAPTLRVCGPAVTVHSPGGDKLWLHRAIYVAQPGDLIVGDTDGVVAIPRTRAAEVRDRLRAGERTLEAYKF